MKRSLLLLLLIALLAVAAQGAAAQAGRGQPKTPDIPGQRGGGHTLFGDLKIDESQVAGHKPQAFLLVLYGQRGPALARQTLMNNGRYQFYNLANGEYTIAIEVEAQEIARIHILLSEVEKTEIRRDIQLEWKPGAVGNSSKPATTSAADLYNRPSANEAVLEKAQEAIREKDYTQAVLLLNQIVSNDPKDFPVLAELGTVYFRQQKLDDAEKAYERALEVKPSFVLALLNLGKLRIAKKNFDGAIVALDKAVKEQPTSPDANFYLGEAYLQIKKGSKAVGYLYEAIKLDPVGKADAHLRLAALYNGAGLKDKAAVEYEQFLAKKPDYPEKEKLKQYIKENKKQ
jgi:tetratricopeptide (TPR) repeat protein